MESRNMICTYNNITVDREGLQCIVGANTIVYGKSVRLILPIGSKKKNPVCFWTSDRSETS